MNDKTIVLALLLVVFSVREVLLSTLGELLAVLASLLDLALDLLGEELAAANKVTIVVEGSSGAPALGTDPGTLRAAVADLEASGSTRKEAIAEVARRAGLPKREVYDVVHR